MGLFRADPRKDEKEENETMCKRNVRKMQKKRVKKEELTKHSTQVCRSIGTAMSEDAREQVRVAKTVVMVCAGLWVYSFV